MREFFDTSVLVAAFWKGHPAHSDSLRLVSTATRERSYCGLHSLAEVYASMTALPVKETILPAQALFFVDEVQDRFTLVALDREEYCRTISDAAKRGFTSGRIYDCLLLGCAVKVDADVIYTWNLKHFTAFDPGLRGKITSPGATSRAESVV